MAHALEGTRYGGELSCLGPVTLREWAFHQAEGDCSFVVLIVSASSFHLWSAVRSFNAGQQCSWSWESSKLLSNLVPFQEISRNFLEYNFFFICSLTLGLNPCVRCIQLIYRMGKYSVTFKVRTKSHEESKESKSHLVWGMGGSLGNEEKLHGGEAI